MSIEIQPAELDKILKEFLVEFKEESDFKVKVVIDTTIPDYHKDFSSVCITVTDATEDLEVRVILDKCNNLFYNTYEDYVERLYFVSDLWKYMYYELSNKFRQEKQKERIRLARR